MSNLGIYQQAGIGSFVSVPTTAALLTTDVSTLSLGTMAFVTAGAGSYYQLVTDGSNHLIWQQVTFSGGGGVTQLVAGTNVSLSPSGGTGNVTVNAAPTPVTTTISGSAVGHVDFTIAGDLSDYEFTAYVVQPPSGTIYYFLAPQATISVSTRTAMLCGTASGSAVTPTRVLTTWTLAGYVGASNSWAIFKGRLYCKTGKPRYAHVNGTSQGSGTVSVVNPGSSYVDTETATTWTTIRFASNTANDGSGTEVSTAYGVGTIITMTPIGYTS
jgi:hypothetical protein